MLTFFPDLDPIGLPESRHEGRLSGKGTLGKKSYIGMEDDHFDKAHYTVLQNSSLVGPYIEKHKEVLRSEIPDRNETWVTHKHMEAFSSWLRKNVRVMRVFQSNCTCWL